MKNHLRLLFIFAAVILANLPSLNAQSVAWAKKGISEGFENGNAIVADDSGNVYVTGQFEFTSVFDSYVLHAYGQHDIFVAKYGPTGNLIWIKKAGGRSGDIGNGIGIDADHNVYVTGEIEDSVTFGSGVNLVSEGSNDGFIAKWDANGNIQWAENFGSATGSDKGRALAVSPSGNCYITGNFTNSTDFDGTTLNTNGGNDIFIVKYDSDGDVEWAKKGGGSAQDRGYGIAIDPSENVYVTGTFSGSATFSGSSVSNSANNATFLAKYDSDGDLEWIEDGGEVDTTKANAIALDDDGNIYIAGTFNIETDFGSYNINAIGLCDVFIVKFDPTGHVEWAKGAGSIDEDIAYGIAVDNANEMVYITGLVCEDGEFGNVPYTIVGYKDIFIAAYNLNGTAKWVQTYGGNLRDLGSAIAVDKSGYIYTTGIFNSNATFGPTLLTGYPNQPWADFFVCKTIPPPASAPSSQSTNLNIASGNCSDLEITFNPGSGDRRIVTISDSPTPFTNPVNGTMYTANDLYGAGSNLGNNHYVVYNGTDDNVTVTGLDPGTIYYFTIYEYNGSGVASTYQTNSPPTIAAMAAIYSIHVSGLQSGICTGETLQLHAIGATTYTWAPMNGLTSVNGGDATANPTSTTNYTVHGTTTNGCYAEASFTIQVNPLPSVSMSSFSPICENSHSITLNNGNPSGGTFSGTGVSNGMFNPSTGAGTYFISYLFTDNNGCEATATEPLLVNAAPVVNLGSDINACAGTSVSLNAGPVNNSYLWSNGSTASAINADSSGTGIGVKTIFVQVTNAAGCTESDTIRITFDLCSGINQADKNIQDIRIYPNPFNDHFNFTTSEEVTYKIYDLCGKLLISEEKISGHVTAGDELAAGVYLVEVFSGKNKKVIRVVKSE